MEHLPSAKAWKQAPFIRLLPALLAGIILRRYFQLPLAVPWSILIAATGVLLMATRLPLHLRYRLETYKGVAMLLLPCCMGYLLLHITDVRLRPDHFARYPQHGSRLILQIMAPLQEKERSWKTTAKVTAILHQQRIIHVSGSVLLYLQKDSNRVMPVYGSRIITAALPRPVLNTGNPGAFDYRQYCAAQQLYHQCYAGSRQWAHLRQVSRHSGYDLLLRARETCIQTIRRYVGNGPEGGMAAALLIGYRDELQPELLETYAGTGVVHIIAVSGMHLAMLYGTLVWLLQCLPRVVWAQQGKAVIIILFLWGFAGVTGATPSVMRAVLMFSGMAIGTWVIGHHTSTGNTLAASAFLLLCHNPHLTTDTGFQLSYLAVTGIMLFYPPLYKWGVFKNKWLDRIWQLLAVSLAAQVLTTPVCVFYFHQFPLYFLPANLVAVPLSTLVIYMLLLLLLLSPFPAAATCCGLIVKWLIMGMNTAMAAISTWPGALLTGLHPTLLQILCCYGAIAAAYIYGKSGKKIIAGCILCCSAIQLYEKSIRAVQRKIIVYQLPKQSGMEFISGTASTYVGDTLKGNAAATVQLSRQTCGIKKITISHQRYISFQGRRFVIIDRALPAMAPSQRLRTDYILLSHHPDISIRQLVRLFAFHTVIFDASCTNQQIRKWKNDCYALTLRCFSVPDEGAYVINL